MIGGGPQKITVEIGGKVAASLGAALQRTQMEVSSFGRNVTRTMNDAATAGRKGFKSMFDNDLWQQAAVGAAGVGIALGASVRQAARFEQSLTDISKIAQLGQAETKALGQEILKLTARSETNQSAEQLAAGIQTLTGAGLELKDAMAAIRGIGRVATATGSEITDVANTSYQLMQNLKIASTDVAGTFEILAAAGKKGSFELRDMATLLPTVASSANSLGVTGVKGAASLAAALQITRRGAGDASTAANNLVDLLQKIQSPDAVKNFKKFGVNIEEVTKNARKNGLNPLEETLKEVQRVTGGDQFKVSQIFGDKQVKNALMPLLRDFDDYIKIRDESLSASGVIDEDYQKQLQTFSETLKSFQNSAQRLGVTVGNALLPPLTRLAEIITPVAEGFAGFASDHPTIAAGVVGITGALAGLILVLPGLVAAAKAFGVIKLAIAGANIGGLIAGWLPALAGAGKALLAFATGPIGLTVLAIAGIGAALVGAYRHFPWFRDAVNAVWSGITTRFQAMVGAVQAGWQGFTTYLGGAWKVFTGMLTVDLGRIREGFGQAFGGIRQIATAWLSWFRAMLPSGVRGIFDKMVTFIKETPKRVANVGQIVIDAILNGLKAKVGELFGWIGGTWNRITSFVRGQPTPEAPAATPGRTPSGGTYRGGQRSARPPGRAMGGPVRAGLPYIVGERRRELFVPGMDGAIVPRVARPVTAAALAALLAAPAPVAAAPSGGSTGRPQVTIHAPVTIDAAGGDPATIRQQVLMAFEDLVARAENNYRVALND